VLWICVPYCRARARASWSVISGVWALRDAANTMGGIQAEKRDKADMPRFSGSPLAEKLLKGEYHHATASTKYGITRSSNVKTAVSINDELLQEADETAKLLGLSRSRLFSLAVGDFLRRQRREQMLRRLKFQKNGLEPAEKTC
jgi:hypothetical protein